MSIVYKLFKSRERQYIYDRNRHKIIALTKEEYDALSNGSNVDEVLKKYQLKGFLQESQLKKIEHPMNQYYSDFKNCHIEQLILQVTQKCNLRCSYCFYGENNYATRSHSDFDMSFEIAQKAIDYLWKNSKTVSELTIGFYGGEPLIRFDFIKKCINYIESKPISRKVSYVMTTNATLLTLEKAKYLAEKNFHLLISLDGTKETHDANRKFVNGKGSYDVIMKNLITLREKVPEFYSNIMFNTVISPQMDLKCVENYYCSNPIMREHNIISGTLAEQYAEKPIEYSEEFYIESKYGRLKIFLFLLHRLGESDLLILNKGAVNMYKKCMKNLRSNFSLPEFSHHGGPCVAGTKRLFVNIKGDLYPCERVSELSNVARIGNIYEGISESAVFDFMNVGAVSSDKCLKCWAFNECRICGSEVDDLRGFDSARKNFECQKTKISVLETYKDLCALKELGWEE